MPKSFPVYWNGLHIGDSPSKQEAWKIARPFVGHADFEAYFDGGDLAYHVYDPTRPKEDPMNNVTRDALGLSSGTIAGLIGNTRYDVIDAVQSKFVLYCKEHEGEFDNWRDAWHSFFKESHPAPDPEFPTVAGEGAPQYTFLPNQEEQLTLKL